MKPVTRPPPMAAPAAAALAISPAFSSVLTTWEPPSAWTSEPSGYDFNLLTVLGSLRFLTLGWTANLGPAIWCACGYGTKQVGKHCLVPWHGGRRCFGTLGADGNLNASEPVSEAKWSLQLPIIWVYHFKAQTGSQNLVQLGR